MGITSKTGTNDDSIPLDSGRTPWLDKILKVWKADGQPNEHLFGFHYGKLFSELKEVAKVLNLPLVPYQLRHSGASVDRATNVRTLDSLRKRGRWVRSKSVRRYEKAGKLNETRSRYTVGQQVFFQQCENQLREIILSSRVPARPLRW